MSTSLKALQKKAQEHGMTVTQLVEELEAGCNPNKPYRFAISFDRLEDLKWFMRHVVELYEDVSDVGVYRANVLDKEYAGTPSGNAFVLRTNNDPVGTRLEL